MNRFSTGSAITLLICAGLSACNSSNKAADMSDVADMALDDGFTAGGDDLAASDGGGNPDLAKAPKTLSFGAATMLSTTSAHAGFMAAGDFNHDGNADLVVGSGSAIVSDSSGNLDPLVSKGDGTFTYDAAKALTAARSAPFSVGDFNQDLKDDIAYFYSVCVTNPVTHMTTCTPHLIVAISNGDGTFTQGGPPAPTYMSSVYAQDLNGDHVVDFISDSNDTMSNKNGFTVFLNNGTNPLTKTDYLSPTYPAQLTPLVVTDLNADASPDVFYGAAGALVIVNGAANGTFAATPTMITTPSNVGTTFVAAADLNADSRPDLIVAHDNMTFSVYTSKATGGYAAPNDYPAIATPTSIATGDFDGDGLIDVATCDQSNLRFFINQGNGFKAPLTIAQACFRLTVADFNRDGLADVATSDGVNAYVLMNTSH